LLSANAIAGERMLGIEISRWSFPWIPSVVAGEGTSIVVVVVVVVGASSRSSIQCVKQ
jgi:hypothetical protein